jgi:Fe-S oxidoreductase
MFDAAHTETLRKRALMNPYAMAFVLVTLNAAFGLTAKQRFELLMVGRPTLRWDRVPERVRGVVEYALAQRKMRYYPAAGLAHMAIFVGFGVLLLNTIILWGRGFFPGFNLFLFGHDQPLGMVYDLLKEIVLVAVIGGASFFVYLRAVKREGRMTLSGEGLVILGIIVTMMVADLLYNGSLLALSPKVGEACVGSAKSALGARPSDGLCEGVRTVVAPLGADAGKSMGFVWHAPASSVIAAALASAAPKTLQLLAHLGFWTHSALVLIFLNILPFSKHFHIITAIFNVFFRNLDKPGRLLPVAASSEAMMPMVEAAMEARPGAEPVGAAKLQDFSWKAILDFYTCTECGRCSDNCPAHKTGKILSPKMLTLDLRDHLYGRAEELIDESKAPKVAPVEGEEAPAADAAPTAELVGDIIHPDVLWACTTCRACEEQCPVMISYVDKIVDMRRNLVMLKGEFPAQLAGRSQAIEVNGNPWNLARVDRGNWAEGLGVPLMSDKPDAKVLYWVGCAASYDDRAKKVARATAQLMKAAGVDFAILGQEETCTGDPARRAGNEYLFLMLAEQNVGDAQRYKEQGRHPQIVTACPHCFNTLANEYPDFGAKFEVVHHTEFLSRLVAEKKLSPARRSVKQGRVPRQLLPRPLQRRVRRAARGAREHPPARARRGARAGTEQGPVLRRRRRAVVDGGAEQGPREREAHEAAARDRGATIATACPFCQTMITDGLKAESKEESIQQLDIAELLLESCSEVEGGKSRSKKKSAEASAE